MIRKTDIPVEAQHEDTYQWLNYSVSLLVSAATEAEQYGAILWLSVLLCIFVVN